MPAKNSNRTKKVTPNQEAIRELYGDENDAKKSADTAAKAKRNEAGSESAQRERDDPGKLHLEEGK